MPVFLPQPDRTVTARVEALLHEQLIERGEDPSSLAPHEISASMRCEVYPDQSMVYLWKEKPILQVVPETVFNAAGEPDTAWRLFTQNSPEANSEHSLKEPDAKEPDV